LRVRRTLAVLAAAAVAALGGVILGEYEFTWTLAPIAGVLFGLFVAEATVTIGRERGLTWAVWTAVCSAAGLAWAGWISVRRTHHGLQGAAWAAIVLGALAAGLRARPVSERVSGTTPEP
jgi:hypothetical protein